MNVHRRSIAWLGMVLCVALGMGCGAANQQPVCHGVSRAELTAIYLAEVGALKLSRVCESYGEDYESCPEFQRLKLRRDKRAARWVECPQ